MTMTVMLTYQVTGEDVYVVLNAGCRDKDIEHIQSYVKKFQVRPYIHIISMQAAVCMWPCTLHTICIFNADSSLDCLTFKAAHESLVFQLRVKLTWVSHWWFN